MKITAEDLKKLHKFLDDVVFDILGLTDEFGGDDAKLTEQLINLILEIRLEAKKNKDYETSDKIRDALQKMGVVVKDKKDGFEWEITGN